MQMENKSGLVAFDMGELRNNLPQKRGLSRYYSGKAKSFTSISDVKCLEDLKKHPPETLDANKKRKKNNSFINNKSNLSIPTYHCRRVSSSNLSASHFVDAL